MTDDRSDLTDPEGYGETTLLDRPVDRVTPAFFRDIVDEYVEADRLETAVARFEVDGDRERCFVVADGLADLSRGAYAHAELDELIAVLESDPSLLEDPLDVTIPVGDADRVIEEAREAGTVSVRFQPTGLVAILEQFRERLDEPTDDGD